MPLQPPDPATIRRVGEHYGLGLSDADAASFSPFVHGLLTSWDAVEALYGSWDRGPVVQEGVTLQGRYQARSRGALRSSSRSVAPTALHSPIRRIRRLRIGHAGGYPGARRGSRRTRSVTSRGDGAVSSGAGPEAPDPRPHGPAGPQHASARGRVHFPALASTLPRFGSWAREENGAWL
jgi:hypothetical protein